MGVIAGLVTRDLAIEAGDPSGIGGSGRSGAGERGTGDRSAFGRRGTGGAGDAGSGPAFPNEDVVEILRFGELLLEMKGVISVVRG